MSLTFVVSTPVPTGALPAQSTSTFLARPALLSVVCPRQATLRMGVDSNRSDGYVIKESEYHDPEETSEDDSGDGFMGEADMDDMLGVAMPDDLASFEKREIQNSKSREELLDKLREIKVRRRDILEDRRKGIGMDNVNNYLNNL